MKGLESLAVVLIGLGCLAGLLWVTNHIDQWVQRLRGVEAIDSFGRRPTGVIAWIVLGAVFLLGFVVFSGGGVDPDIFPYRR